MPAGEARDQRGRTVERLGNHGRIDPPLEAIGGLGRDAGAARRPPHRGRHEERALEEQHARAGGHLGHLPAHDAGQRHRPAGVGNHQVGGVEDSLDAVEG